MRLPVSQFVLIEVPLGGELCRVGYDLFDVVVAPLSLFDLWVQPHVRCCVRQLADPECVDIQCVDFQLRSSPAVQRLRLNERVRFAVTTRFSCEGPPGAEGIRSTTHLQAEVAPPVPFSYLPDGVLTSVGEAAVHAALANLQGTFVRSLARDYARWATNAGYRAERLRWAKQSDEAVGSGASTPPLSGLIL
ncbi:hypothetical protein WJX81_000443 [Elliptochloris bilobata]|uniref:Uncharacterized protein n=1 Tax=Elliptochloris bilobata TaxID=381761 RepID=A0AAW1SG74_9CHLO